MVVSPVSANIIGAVAPATAPVPPPFTGSATIAGAGTAAAATAATGGPGAPQAAAVQQPSIQQTLLAALEQAFFTDVVNQFVQSGLLFTDPALAATLTSTFELDNLLGTGPVGGSQGQLAPDTNIQALGADLAMLLSSLAPETAVGTLLNTFI